MLANYTKPKKHRIHLKYSYRHAQYYAVPCVEQKSHHHCTHPVFMCIHQVLLLLSAKEMLGTLIATYITKQHTTKTYDKQNQFGSYHILFYSACNANQRCLWICNRRHSGWATYGRNRPSVLLAIDLAMAISVKKCLLTPAAGACELQNLIVKVHI